MTKSMKRNLLYFSRVLVQGLVTTFLMIILMVGYFYMFGNTDLHERLWLIVAIYGAFGGVLSASILFMQQQSTTVPMALGFGTTRKAVYLTVLIEKVVFAVFITIICLITISQAFLEESMPLFGDTLVLAAVIFTLIFLMCSFGELCGCLQYLMGKWGLITYFGFLLGAIVVFVMGVSKGSIFALPLQTLLWTVVAVFAALSVIASIISAGMMRKYMVKG